MSDRSVFSVGAAAKFCGAFAEAGGTPLHLNKLAERPESLGLLIASLSGKGTLNLINHGIYLSERPRIPHAYWKIESHIGEGVMEWDPKRIGLFWSHRQLAGNSIPGLALQQTLRARNISVLNANVLDFLLNHPDLIPEEWYSDELRRYIFFWGTIYWDTEIGLPVVRALVLNDAVRGKEAYAPIGTQGDIGSREFGWDLSIIRWFDKAAPAAILQVP